MLGTTDIMKIIPHRYPILMVDKAVIVEPDKKITGYKSVSGNEPFFQGHFPGQPIMPGVLIVEAMAQAACVLMLSKPELKNKLAFFMGIDKVKFRKPVVPGDQLELRVEILRGGGRVGKARGEAFVKDEMVTEAEFMFAIIEPQSNA
ncbi:MAG TPA: 3-hydroxyacyl-ACP dehydratase FabZ [Elusimicrobiota bacterium]|nr:3-hydroxyacyl-ACP dehydratase FabZ [Elusimicrobiota bacterium]